MNLFRSEEHVRGWALFNPASAEGIKPVAEIAAAFSLPFFRQRLAPDYLLHIGEYAPEVIARFAELGKSSRFWQMAPPLTT